MQNNDLLWIDLETTSLEPKNGRILEIGMIKTDEDLEEQECYHKIVRCTTQQIKGDSVAIEMHCKSGLLYKAIKSSHDLSTGNTPDTLTNSIVNWLLSTGSAHLPVAGSSVHFDRKWIRHCLPIVSKLLNYQSLDVSSVCRGLGLSKTEIRKELDIQEERSHRVLDDLRQDIEVLKYIREKWDTAI